MNKKYLISIVLIIIGTILFSLAISMKKQSSTSASLSEVATGKQDENNNINKVIIGGQEITVELADTPSKRAQGLSERDPLPAGTGMLFIFDQPSIYSFWMNKMKFSIDIIWIHEEKVVAIWANATVPDESGIPRFTPDEEAKYVLEVNAGFVQENSLKVGDLVTIDLD